LGGQIESLLQKLGKLEVNNKSMTEKNIRFRAKFTAAEVKLITIECEIASTRHKSLQKAVELTYSKYQQRLVRVL
jgi:hypothetical protein